MIGGAAARGAARSATPEIVGMLEPKRDLALAKAKPEETHEVLAAFRGLAAELGVWLLIGSISIKVSEDRMSNRSFLLDDRGQRSEEHTSELQSLMRISYAVFCLKKKNKIQKSRHNMNIRDYIHKCM